MEHASLVTLFQLLGGIGLFLTGMSLLSEGLTHFAGDALRRALLRFTGTPARAFGSGLAVTLLVQSSTATTVTLIGFVSAGLISFTQALGVVMGASLGTTGTGWLVSTLGLKISLGFYSLPLIGLGAFMKLLTRGRWQALGMALAGFGMLFVGIDTLQDGLRDSSNWLALDSLAGDSWRGRLLTLGAGILLTVILQSSTAMVATTLTALNAGAVTFEQAAILVVGAAIGTTMTGVLAALGGSLMAKRTALAHVLFNLSSGLIALALLPALLGLLTLAQQHLGLEPGAVSLAAFHSLFIALGVLLFLPRVDACARLITRLLPQKDSQPADALDQSQLHVPALALTAAGEALRRTTLACLRVLQAAESGPGAPPAPLPLSAVEQSLDSIQDYFARIPVTGATETARLQDVRQAHMHAVDHLRRLTARARQREGRSDPVPPQVADGLALYRQLLVTGITALSQPPAEDLPRHLAQADQLAAALREQRRLLRHQVMGDTARGTHPAGEALQILDALRWMERTGQHIWRLCHYLCDPPSEASKLIASDDDEP